MLRIGWFLDILRTNKQVLVPGDLEKEIQLTQASNQENVAALSNQRKPATPKWKRKDGNDVD